MSPRKAPPSTQVRRGFASGHSSSAWAAATGAQWAPPRPSWRLPAAIRSGEGVLGPPAKPAVPGWRPAGWGANRRAVGAQFRRHGTSGTARHWRGGAVQSAVLPGRSSIFGLEIDLGGIPLRPLTPCACFGLVYPRVTQADAGIVFMSACDRSGPLVDTWDCGTDRGTHLLGCSAGRLSPGTPRFEMRRCWCLLLSPEQVFIQSAPVAPDGSGHRHDARSRCDKRM